MTEAKVKSLMVHEIDPKNALGTIDLDSIDSVAADNQERRYIVLLLLLIVDRVCYYRPNAFAVITAGRVFTFVAESPASMHRWIGGIHSSTPLSLSLSPPPLSLSLPPPLSLSLSLSSLSVNSLVL